MNSESRRNFENDSRMPTCLGQPRACFVHSFVLTISTLIFIISMVLTVYLNQNANLNRIITVLIVTSSLLYILGFTSYMYHIYNSKTISVISSSDNNSNDQNQATRISTQNSSTSGRRTEMVRSFSPIQPIRITPPPPYDTQISEMSRVLLDSSRTTDSSTRESEITEEAIKLLQRMYGDIRRAGQQMGQSPRNEPSVQQLVQSSRFEPSAEHSVHSSMNELSVQQLVQSPRFEPSMAHSVHSSMNELSVQQLVQSPRKKPSVQQLVKPSRNEPSVQQLVQPPEKKIRQQETIVPKVSHPNVVINLHDNIMKSVPARGPTTSDLRKNRRIKPQEPPNLPSNQLDLQRLLIGSEGCGAAPPQPSHRTTDFLQERILPKVSRPNLVVTLQETAFTSAPFHGLVPSDFKESPPTQQQVILQSLPNKVDSQRWIIGSEGHAIEAQPNLSPRGENISQVARKRKLVSFSKALQTIPKTIAQSSEDVMNNGDSQNNTYEPTEFVRNMNSSQQEYDSAVVRSLPSGNSFQETYGSAVVRNLPSCTSSQAAHDSAVVTSLPSVNSSQVAYDSAVKSLSSGNSFQETYNSAVVRSLPRGNSSQVAYDSAVVRNLPGGNSSQTVYGAEYYCNESEVEDSSVGSSTSDTGTVDRKRNFRNQNAKLRRQLSAPSTRKFRQLGQSPETVLDAIATCYDLTPDEWMVAWKLGQKGVSDTERARLLGVSLHENSSRDNLRPAQIHEV